MNRKPRNGGIREEILREWRGCDEVKSLNDGVHSADQFIAAILRATD